MKQATLTLNYNGYDYTVDSNHLPRRSIGVFLHAAVHEIEKMIEEEKGKKYTCDMKKTCNQYLRQGNKATSQCEGCGSLWVSL